MDAMLNVEIENTMQCLLESYELAIIHGDETFHDTTPYLENMEALCRIKDDANRCEMALREAKEEHSITNLRRKYSALESSTSQFNPKKCAEYKAFHKRLQQIKDAAGVQETQVNATSNASRVECDEFVMESEINIYDPLTKLRMTDPVRNPLCGHHYEKSSILESIKINPRLRCPVAGCGNNQFIQAKQLQEDNALKVRLLKMVETESEDPLAF